MGPAVAVTVTASAQKPRATGCSREALLLPEGHGESGPRASPSILPKDVCTEGERAGDAQLLPAASSSPAPPLTFPAQPCPIHCPVTEALW